MTVDLANKIIDVVLGDLTLVSGTIYTYGTDTKFRVDLMAIMDNEDPMVFPQAYLYTQSKTIAGTPFAPFLEIINGYQVRFPDLQITVLLQETNNNLFDVAAGVLYQNQCQVIPSNSAGLSIASSGGGTDWTVAEKGQIRKRLGIDGTTSSPAATPDLATADELAIVKDQATLAATRSIP
jgi:hypothetical protein